MTEYAIKKKDIFSETDEPESDYDLMTVIIIRRGKETDIKSIFDYLNGVFSCDIKKIEKYSHIEWIYPLFYNLKLFIIDDQRIFLRRIFKNKYPAVS